MRAKKAFLVGALVVVTTGLIIPQNFENPVKGADRNSFNAKSFWFFPWRKSGVHKGVDIFARMGTSVGCSTGGLVLYTGEIEMGGKVVLVLGPKWRLHYYAHLATINTAKFSWANKGEIIGTVGTTGNAKGKSPHLHYSILTVITYPWRMDGEKQGWKKMFYLDPLNYLSQ